MKAKLFILLFGILGVGAQVSANRKIYVNSEVTNPHRHAGKYQADWTFSPQIVSGKCTDNIVHIKPYLESDSLQAV